MGDLWLRLKRRYILTRNNWISDNCFSKRFALYRLVGDIGGRLGLKKLAKSAKEKKEQWILSYLKTMLYPIIKKYQACEDTGIYYENAPIWVCWWTGLDTAPRIVQRCVKSIYDQSNNHPVYLITKENYCEYIDVPSYIFKKMEDKHMCLAHFADYIRVSLLEKHGGIWLDATIFCSQTIPDQCFSAPFFTCKSNPRRGEFLSDYQWVTFCLGGWQHNLFFKYLKEAFECYWMNNDYAIDYLFFDHMIYIAKESIPFVKELIENVPINNIHRDDLQAAMNAALPADEFQNVLQKDTAIYKLSWRESYEDEVNGIKTVYNFFITSL